MSNSFLILFRVAKCIDNDLHELLTEEVQKAGRNCKGLLDGSAIFLFLLSVGGCFTNKYFCLGNMLKPGARKAKKV